jgi:hypothetical protein
MLTGVHEFDLTDARGVSHHYVVTEHPGGAGISVMYRLLSLGAPTVASIAAAALASERVVALVTEALADGDGDGASISADDVGEIFKILAELDVSEVGAAIGAALGSKAAIPLTYDILAFTSRDNRPVKEVFDTAYQANWMELGRAVWAVCGYNRFLVGVGTSSS